MTRLLPLIVAVSLASCGGQSQPWKAKAPSGPRPIHLHVKSLPSQGLFLQEGRSVLLVGLDGHRYLKLRNYWIDGPDWLKPAVFDRVADLTERFDDDPSHVYPGFALLGNKRGQMYRLDPGKKELIPVDLRHIPLPGGAVLSGRNRAHDLPLFTVSSRRLRLRMASDLDLHVIGGKIAVNRGQAVDLESGRRWKVPSNCEVAGEHAGTLYALCNGYDAKHSRYVGHLAAFSKHGIKRRAVDLGGPAGIAWLSPNGRYIATMVAPNCGPAPSELVVVKTGDVRPLESGSKWTTGEIFGWTSDNQLVSTVSTDFSECADEGPPPPIYVIDPRTLSHRYVLTTSDVWIYMWGTLENPS